MPELPEVETTRRGIAPHITGQRITAVRVRQPRLRWPVPDEIAGRLPGAVVERVERRAKYLLLRTGAGTVILHLGMSGSLRILPADVPPGPHDHVDLAFGDRCLRLRDPRRFGAVLWTEQDPLTHPRLRELGPEPLSEQFNGDHLYRAARGRQIAVKSLLMDGKVVVGVGNIYANEALFKAGIHPSRAAGRISWSRYVGLVEAVKQTLAAAIELGGTTLRDFLHDDGKPGYFRNELLAYGRGGEPCVRCGRALIETRIGQRSTVYCGHCQR